MVARFETRAVAESQTVGEMLAARRNQFGYSVEKASEKSQVAEEHILALEKQDFESLPADVYVQSFVKRYAEALDLDGKQVCQAYRKERKIQEKLQNKKEKGGEKKTIPTMENTRMVITPKLLRRLVVGGIILIALGYVIFQLARLGQPPSMDILQPTEDITVQDNVVHIVGETEVNASVTINGQPVSVDDQGMFQQMVNLEPGINDIVIVSTNRLGRENEIIRRIRAVIDGSSSYQPQPVTIQQALVAHPLSVTVLVEDTSTWLSVFVDGLPTFQGTIAPDTRQSFAGFQRITVTTGQSAKTRVIFNGEDIGYLGQEGDTLRRLEFTQDSHPRDLLTFR
ncbi:RodZ domain-containing protein [Patescibacteria group bacterium]